MTNQVIESYYVNSMEELKIEMRKDMERLSGLNNENTVRVVKMIHSPMGEIHSSIGNRRRWFSDIVGVLVIYEIT